MIEVKKWKRIHTLIILAALCILEAAALAYVCWRFVPNPPRGIAGADSFTSGVWPTEQEIRHPVYRVKQIKSQPVDEPRTLYVATCAMPEAYYACVVKELGALDGLQYGPVLACFQHQEDGRDWTLDLSLPVERFRVALLDEETDCLKKFANIFVWRGEVTVELAEPEDMGQLYALAEKTSEETPMYLVAGTDTVDFAVIDDTAWCIGDVDMVQHDQPAYLPEIGTAGRSIQQTSVLIG